MAPPSPSILIGRFLELLYTKATFTAEKTNTKPPTHSSPSPAFGKLPPSTKSSPSESNSVTDPLVTACDITFRYPSGRFEFHIPSFAINQGEALALTGTSGSGKSTLAQLISGILIPQQGAISLAGETLSSLSEAARRAYRSQHIGFLFQDGGLIDYLPAIENILLPYHISPALTLTREVTERAHALAETLDVTTRLDALPASLSGGERQRIALARALVTQPVLIIADEPTSGLDPHTATKALDLLLSSAKESKSTLLTITHDPAAAARHDRTVDLSKITQS